MAVELKYWRFTVDDYYRMAEAGILGEDDRVELIEGEILEMSPIGGRHMACVNRLTRVFVPAVGDAAIVSIQNPIRLDNRSEPQPDLVLMRPKDDYYASGHATPADVLLVVEVADSSIEFDRQIKAPLYARHAVPELWVVDLGRDHVMVYREPAATGYATTQVFRRGDTISPGTVPELQIAVVDILG